MLQNHYGDREYPVRSSWVNGRRYRAALQLVKPRRAALYGLVQLAPALVLLPELLSYSSGSSKNGQDEGFVASLVAFAVLVVGGVLTGRTLERAGLVREQRRYRRLTGDIELTPRQQQLLALDAHADYAIGGWNSSLDYAPAWSRMPRRLRAQHESDRRAGAIRPLLVSLPLFEVPSMRARLNQHHHLASGADLELFVADGLAEES